MKINEATRIILLIGLGGMVMMILINVKVLYEQSEDTCAYACIEYNLPLYDNSSGDCYCGDGTNRYELRTLQAIQEWNLTLRAPSLVVSNVTYE